TKKKRFARQNRARPRMRPPGSGATATDSTRKSGKPALTALCPSPPICRGQPEKAVCKEPSYRRLGLTWGGIAGMNAAERNLCPPGGGSPSGGPRDNQRKGKRSPSMKAILAPRGRRLVATLAVLAGLLTTAASARAFFPPQTGGTGTPPPVVTP